MQKLKYKFTKIHNNHNRLRDNVIECWCRSEVVVGKMVALTAPSRDFADGIRQINTSLVTEILERDDNHILFKTQSGSTYRIDSI